MHNGRDHETLRELGHLLYGRNFVAPLARDLGVNPRNLQRMLAGTKPIPENIPLELVPLVRNRVAHIFANLLKKPDIQVSLEIHGLDANIR